MKTSPKNLLLWLALLAGLGLMPAGRALASFQISGHVKDNLGNPVVEIQVTGDDYVGDVYPAKTDADGFYSVEVPADGNFRVTVSCAQLAALGYACVDPGVVSITSDSVQLDFVVKPAVRPLQITNTLLPKGNAGAVYSAKLGAKGGQAPYHWQLALDSTNLPAGLSLNSNGLLSGTPMTNSMSNLKVQVTDANDTVTSKILFITINPDPLLNAPASLTNGLPLPDPQPSPAAQVK